MTTSASAKMIRQVLTLLPQFSEAHVKWALSQMNGGDDYGAVLSAIEVLLSQPSDFAKQVPPGAVPSAPAQTPASAPRKAAAPPERRARVPPPPPQRAATPAPARRRNPCYAEAEDQDGAQSSGSGTEKASSATPRSVPYGEEPWEGEEDDGEAWRSSGTHVGSDKNLGRVRRFRAVLSLDDSALGSLALSSRAGDDLPRLLRPGDRLVVQSVDDATHSVVFRKHDSPVAPMAAVASVGGGCSRARPPPLAAERRPPGLVQAAVAGASGRGPLAQVAWYGEEDEDEPVEEDEEELWELEEVRDETPLPPQRAALPLRESVAALRHSRAAALAAATPLQSASLSQAGVEALRQPQQWKRVSFSDEVVFC
mmetsp:Transcript_135990/g.302828  ORF Transcript_135990/g.302828 Transcript_135990/m.302828 type:complete len:368 (-) Transcript_135990:102-1205(-)